MKDERTTEQIIEEAYDIGKKAGFAEAKAKILDMVEEMNADLWLNVDQAERDLK